jgi:hypothetical protein
LDGLTGGVIVSDVKAEAEDTLIKALDHRERRSVLKTIGHSETGLRYSDLLGEFGMSTGKLNYQLRQLEGLLEKTDEGRYLLTPLGKKAVALLSYIDEGLDSTYEVYLSKARLAQRNKLSHLTRSLLKGLAAFNVFILILWGYLGYISITEDAPTAVFIIILALLALGVAALSWLIRALKTAPDIIERWEQKIQS